MSFQIKDLNWPGFEPGYQSISSPAPYQLDHQFFATQESFIRQPIASPQGSSDETMCIAATAITMGPPRHQVFHSNILSYKGTIWRPTCIIQRQDIAVVRLITNIWNPTSVASATGGKPVL